MITWIQETTSGRKAYILCAIGFILGVVGWITGYLEPAEAQRILWEAMTGAAIRAGIAKT